MRAPTSKLNIAHNWKNKLKAKNITLENIAIGSTSEIVSLKQVQESSSSTLSNINFNSKYFKKKEKLLNFFSKK